jgi:hypothetical protein
MATNIGSILAQSGATAGQLMGGGIANLGAGLSSGIGGMLTNRRKAEEKAEAQQLLQQYSNDPRQLLAIAQKYAIEGKAALAQTFESASQSVSTRQNAQADQLAAEVDSGSNKQLIESQLLGRQKRSVAQTAEKLGMPDLARSVRVSTSTEEIAEIAKQIRQEQIARTPSQTPGQRRQRALAAGISSKEFDEADLAKATDEFFESYVTGQKAKVEAWVNLKGEIKPYRFLNGKVYNEELKKFVEPSELGLIQPAPSVQQVLDATSKLSLKLQEANADDIITQRTNARDAVVTINRLDRQLERIGNMPTGIAANLETGLRQVGQLIRLPYDPSLVNAQTYMIEAATFVKEQIKAFGSGTGLSDKDLAFTEKMVGADPKVQAETLERILGLYRQAAVDTVKSYNKLVTTTSKKSPEVDMVGYEPLVIPESEQPPLSPDAIKYIPQQTGG